jgi:hypothetical protein
MAILGPLRALDPVAYLRFASVYKAFTSADDFEEEIALLRMEEAAASAPTVEERDPVVEERDPVVEERAPGGPPVVEERALRASRNHPDENAEPHAVPTG